MSRTYPIPSDSRFIDLTGQTFSRLTVISYAGKRGTHPRWNCRCECGTEWDVDASAIACGNTKSCGCLKAEQIANRSRTHGATITKKTPEYICWLAIKKRCKSKKYKHYKRYGGRGITVCKRWDDSFADFFADMGSRPSPKHSIDRIDNNGSYEPGNCRWATVTQQASNKQNTIRVTSDGKTMTLLEWSAELGIKRDVLYRRFKRHGSILIP